ncbi:extracellular solute-binding protein [Brachybacterium sp. GCM10030267]|uniref:extracellular solute-binding protein n=1 Tax=Brachybacterium sp. GCM10030267 TaxID=3273381 RepID=UPI003616F873
MINRRTLLRALGAGASVTIAGGSIVGCASRPVGEDRDPNHVRVWGAIAAFEEYETNVIEAFTEQNPDIKVTISPAPSNGSGDNSPVITAVRGRTGPDLYWMDRFNGAQFASLGLLEPINDLIEEYEGVSPEEYMSGWVKFATDELYYDGQWYGLPLDTDTRALFYNKDLADEAGIDPALLDPANGPMTIDQMWDINDSFNIQDERGTYEKLTWIPWDDQGSLLMWAYAYDVQMFDDDSCNMMLNSEDMLGVARTYSEWVKRLDFPRVDAFKATYQPPNAPPSQTSFFSGRQLFQISVPDSVGSLLKYKPDMRYGLTHLPTAREGGEPFNWAGGFAFVMPKGSSMSEAAWKLMTFYTGYEGQKIYMPGIKKIPTNIKAAKDPEAFDPEIQFFVDQMPYATSRLPLPVGTKVWDAMFTMQDSLNQQSKTPEEAVRIAQDYVNPTMQQFCPVRLPEGYGEPDPNFTADDAQSFDA